MRFLITKIREQKEADAKRAIDLAKLSAEHMAVKVAEFLNQLFAAR